MRAAAYTRISRDREGQALGVGRQEADARKLAQDRGWSVVQVFSDNDVTASGARKRPGWDALLNAMAAGDVQAVVAYSSSRLYRNLRDLTAFIDIVQEHGIEVATVVSGAVQVDTADGRMMARILASIDQGEWERGRERYMRKRADLIANGLWTGGWVPYGYEVGEDGKLRVFEPEAAVVRDAAARILNGETVGSVLRRWAADGVVTPRGNRWRHQPFSDLMQRDLPGILAETDSEKLRALWASRRIGPRVEGRHVLTGLLACSLCGRKLVHRPQGGVRTYICLNDDDPSRAPRAELRVDADAVERYVISEAGRRHVPRPQALVDTEAPLYAERQRIVAEMDELADSDLPLRMLERRAARLQRELDRVDDELRAVPPDTAANSAGWAAYRGFDFADHQDPALRAWLQTLVDEVVVAPARRGANRFEAERVSIAWRRGVALAK